MPRRGSVSSLNLGNVQRDTFTDEFTASVEPSQADGRQGSDTDEQITRDTGLFPREARDADPEAFVNDTFMSGASNLTHQTHLSEPGIRFEDHYSRHELTQLPINELQDMHGAHYDGTGLSDDGRSLTPDPHSSEAETEHIADSENDDDGTLTKDLAQEHRFPVTSTMHISEDGYLDDDIPADLDALSDSDSSVRSIPSVESQDNLRDYDIEDEADIEHERHNQSLEDDDAMEDDTASVDPMGNTQVAKTLDSSILQRSSTTRVSRFGILASTKPAHTVNSDDELDNIDDDLEDGNDNDDGDDDDDDDDDDDKDDEPKNILESRGNLTVSGPDDYVTGKDIVPTIPGSDAGNRRPQTRKRSRSPAVSPSNTKRLAPLKTHADLDSDEDGDEPATSVTGVSKDKSPDAKSNSHDKPVLAPHTADLLATVPEPEVETLRDSPEEDELDEADEEVQDDTEREERNKHRQAAMEALRQIEVEFTKLRAQIYDERMKQIDREIALAESGLHPLVVDKTLQNQNRLTSRIRRAETLRDRRGKEANTVLNASKFIAHSQFSQDRQKLRATLLSKTSAEWFQIHREKRIIDMAVPEYGYLVPERRTTQLKQRREYEAEVSVLAGLKSFVGFPAAPSISTAAIKEIDSDLSEMGILKSVNRDNHKQSHSSRQHMSLHTHISVPSHANHHLHNNHNHSSHPMPHSKAHHRKAATAAKQRSGADKSDHHSQAHHLHTRNSSPQITPRPQFHTHSYQGEAPVRKGDSMVTLNGPLNDMDHKPMLHSTNQDTKGHETGRDKLPLSLHKLAQPQPGNYHQGGSLASSIQFEQKLAQNLPNILRQDSQEMKAKQLPALPHLANGGHHSNMDYLGSNGTKSNFAAQFWTSKHPEPGRTPAPAMSSNSAFNATLSQPGSSAAYIPPARTYSPAGQHQNNLYKSNQSHTVQPQQMPGKPFPVNGQFPTHSKELAVQHPPLFHPKAQQVAPDARVLFGPPLPPRQES